MNNFQNVPTNELLAEISNALSFIESKIKESSEPSDFLCFEEAKSFLNISTSHLRKLVFERAIPVRRIGRKLLFSKQELLSWIEGMEA